MGLKLSYEVKLHNPANPTCKYSNPREMKTYVHTKPCMWMFIVALFIISNNYKPPKYLSMGIILE